MLVGGFAAGDGGLYAFTGSAVSGTACCAPRSLSCDTISAFADRARTQVVL